MEGPSIRSFNLYERCDGENGDAFRRPLIFTYIRTEYYMLGHNGKNIKLASNIINEMYERLFIHGVGMCG